MAVAVDVSDEASSRRTVSVDLMQDHELARRDRSWRRAAIVLISVFVIAGTFGVWGPRQQVVHVGGDRHRITVSVPAVSRAGLAATWELGVRSEDGEPLGVEVEVGVDQSYLAIFDQHAIDPVPSATWATDGVVHWRFDLPTGLDTFTVTLDARIQPDARWRHEGRFEVSVDGETLTADTTTWLVP